MNYKIIKIGMGRKQTIKSGFSNLNQAMSYLEKIEEDFYDRFHSSVEPSPCSGRGYYPNYRFDIEEY